MAEKLPTLEDFVADIEKQKTAPAASERHEPPTVKDAADQVGPTPKETVDVVEVAEVDGAANSPSPPITAAEPAKEEKRDPQAAKFAALARREKEQRSREQEMDRRLKEIEEKSRALSEKEVQISNARRPLDILKAHGLTYAQVTEDVLGTYKEPEADPLESKLSERMAPVDLRLKVLDEKIANYERELAKIQTERVEAARRDVTKSIVDTAAAKNCELIMKIGDEAVVLVQDVISQYYRKNARVLSYDEACDIVESYYTSYAEKLLDTQKLKSRYASTLSTPAAKTPMKKEANERPNTLTQSHSTATRSKPDLDRLSKNDAIELLASQIRYKD